MLLLTFLFLNEAKRDSEKVSKLHIAYACVTWFKGKVLNQGLEEFFELLILSL